MRQGIFLLSLFLFVSTVFSEEAVKTSSPPSSEAVSVPFLTDPSQKLAMLGKNFILVKDISELYHQQLKQMKEQGMTISPAIHDYIVTGLISRKIEEKLMLAEAKKKKFGFDSSQSDEFLNKFKAKFKSLEDYQNYLQGKGMTETDIADRIRERLLINTFQLDLFKNLTVSDEEANHFFIQNEKRINPPESWKIAQIMKRFSDNSSDPEIEKIKEELSLLRKDILEKKLSFESLAQKHSQGATAGQGGLIGWINTETSLEPELFEAIKSLKKGELSPVIVLKNSVQLIKIEEYIPPVEKKNFDSVKTEIKNSLILEKKKTLLMEFMEKAKKETGVELLYKSSLS